MADNVVVTTIQLDHQNKIFYFIINIPRMYAVRLTTEGGTLVALYSITYEKILILFYVFKTNSQMKSNNGSDVFALEQTILKDSFLRDTF